MSNYDVYQAGGVPIKAWVRGVLFEDEAQRQLERVSRLPFIYKWLAAMPDVHAGLGATVGSVIATKGAVVPSAVGVDIGCGMRGVLTPLVAQDLPGLPDLRRRLEARIPVGFGVHRRIHRDVKRTWEELEPGHGVVISDLPAVEHKAVLGQLGTLGGGNHFIEVSLDEENRVWLVIHSGSRGVGNRIGTQYIKVAKAFCKKCFISLEDQELAYFPQDTDEFSNYMFAVLWAQQYALKNRELMMQFALEVLGTKALETIDCHHNYTAVEHHFGENVIVTRKGAISARAGELGIVPGSMGAQSYIVRGLGNLESFTSCSHGAGRAMSRTKAKATFTVEDHVRATEGVECRKDNSILDEAPGSYKDILAVMKAQEDLCEPVHVLKQILCVKG